MNDQHGEALENDVCFILTSAFLIFTMQTGYGLLESGTVSRKNEVNILLKNAVNIICGALAFWCYGFAFSSRDADVAWLRLTDPISVIPTPPSWKNDQKTSQTYANSSWTKIGGFFTTNIVTPNRFFLHVTNSELIGTTYAEMAFQLAYATTCTAIISGAMAERVRFFSYMIFSFFSNVLFCLPARWIMFNGWLRQVGVIDIGGSGTVHLVGGCAGLVAAVLLGPRLGRFDGKFKQVPMGNPTNAVHGIILLWWGWLGYSAGSSFGITGDKWKYASRSSVATILASMAGGAFGMVYSAITQHGLQDIKTLSYSILASLVAISGGAPIIRPIYAIVTGIIAAACTLITIPLLERAKIDDPTDSFPVHAVAGAWGMIAIGLFSDPESVVHYKQGYRENITVTKEDMKDLRQSLLIAQLYAILVLVLWSLLTTFLLLLPIKLTIGLRMPAQEEILGPDFVEHGIIHDGNRQLLNIIKQKIRFVHSDGMSEAQASAEVTSRYAEQQRLRALRKRSLTGHRSSVSSVSPEQELMAKFRNANNMERQQKLGKYYHNHERKRLSIRSILDATHGSLFNQPANQARPSTSAAASSPPVWATNVEAALSAQPQQQQQQLPSRFQPIPRQPQRRIQLGQYLEAAERTRNSPGSYTSPPLPPIAD